MHSFSDDLFYSFRADANALGGFLKVPDCRIIPTLAPVSLPSVGGFATARSGGFNLEEIISCSAASTRVSGVLDRDDGSVGILTTAVVEDLNILDVVTAERVVAQLSISLPKGGTCIDISLAGTRFEGLRLAGCDVEPTWNQGLMFPSGPPSGRHLPLSWQDVQTAGQAQATALTNAIQGRGDPEANRWAAGQHGWMNSRPPPPGGNLFCSALDGFSVRGSIESYGHIVLIPGFGRFHFGELFLSCDSAQLVMIRAELGCPVRGKVSICNGGGGGGDGRH